MMQTFKTTIAETVRTIVAVVIGVLLALILIVLVSRAPGHDEIYEQQQMNTEQLRFVSCLMIIHPDDITPEAIANCQAPTDG